MTIEQAVKVLFERSKMSQEQYAQSVLGVTRTYLNAVIGERAVASPALLGKAMGKAGLTWNDCLSIPPAHEEESEQEAVLRIIRKALAAGGEDRQHVLEQVEVLKIRANQRERKRRSRSRVRSKEAE